MQVVLNRHVCQSRRTCKSVCVEGREVTMLVMGMSVHIRYVFPSTPTTHDCATLQCNLITLSHDPVRLLLHPTYGS